MGRYMFVGVATHLYVKRDYYTTQEILTKLEKEIDLNLYDVNKEKCRNCIKRKIN